MADLYHYWGGDLSASPQGDLATVDGINLGIQRVIRRLMTCPGELLWHPTYGAGLPQLIGLTRDDRVIKARVYSQIYREACVSRTPLPAVSVVPITNGVSVYVKYTDKFAQVRVQFSFPVFARPVSQSSQTDLSVEVPGS